MTKANDPLDPAIASLAEELADEATEHPSIETLLLDARQQLPDAARSRLEEHYSICAVCARFRLELPELIENRQEATDPAGQRRALARLEQALEEESAREESSKRPRRALVPLVAVAATIVAALGLAWLVQRPEPGRELSPEMNKPSISLSVGIDRTRAAPVHLADESRGLLVIVPVPGATSESVYQVILRDADRGNTLWKSAPSPHEKGELTLSFEPGELAPGLFEIEVLEVIGRETRSLGSSRLRVTSR